MNFASRFLFVGLGGLGLLAACRSAREHERVTPEFTAHAPQAILVLPPIDRDVDPDAPALVQHLVEQRLEDLGYPSAGSSATLHVVISDWPRHYGPFTDRAGSRVSLEARLYDDESGVLLWSGACNLEPERDESGTDPLGEVFDSLVGSATGELSIDTLADDAVRVLLDTFPRRRPRVAPATKPDA